MRYFLPILFLLSLNLRAQQLYYPPIWGDEWESLSPDSLGWDTTELRGLMDYLESEETRAFIVLQDGRIVVEEYFQNFDQATSWPWFSAGKSLAAFLAGIALQEGALDLDDPTSTYLGEGWTAAPPEKEALITIRHQLTMTTGLDESKFTCTEDSCLHYVADAGTRWAYHNGPYTLLHKVVEEATGQLWNPYTRTRIKDPTGMDGLWLPSGGNNIFWSTARSMARYGLLMLGGGAWDGDTLMHERDYFQNMITPSQDLNPSYGYLWWLNGQESFIPPGVPVSLPGPLSPRAPDDLYLAAGLLGQYCAVYPSEGLVMIRMGLQADSMAAPVNLHDEIWYRLLRAIEGPSPVTEVPAEELFHISPNPVRNFLLLKTVDDAPFRLQILDQSGSHVLTSHNRKMVPVGKLSPGVYFLRFYQRERMATARFVKY